MKAQWSLAVCLLLGCRIAYAAAPVVKSLSAPSQLSGEVVNLSAQVSDADTNLSSVKFFLAGPGISGWSTLGTFDTTGASATLSQPWTAGAYGLYTARVEVTDLTGYGAASQVTFDVFSERRTVAKFTLGYGQGMFLNARGELSTTTDSVARSTTAANNSNLVILSTGRIVLKPGFEAAEGAFFWAAIDHDEDSYSDLEELTDNDHDGMFDAWEADHGLSSAIYDPNGNPDGDDLTNIQEFAANRDPNVSDNPVLAQGYDLVIVNGSLKYGIQTSNWRIQSL